MQIRGRTGFSVTQHLKAETCLPEYDVVSRPERLLSGGLGNQRMRHDDLTSLKGDMIAFVEGHGMKRFRGYVSEDLPSITWDAEDETENWKDFVEVAKASGAAFLTMNDFVLQSEDIDYLIDQLRGSQFLNPEDIEEARWLRTYVGRTGFVQLGCPYQGVLFLYEISTDWYDRYQRLVDLAEECGGLPIDEPDQDDER